MYGYRKGGGKAGDLHTYDFLFEGFPNPSQQPFPWAVALREELMKEMYHQPCAIRCSMCEVDFLNGWKL